MRLSAGVRNLMMLGLVQALQQGVALVRLDLYSGEPAEVFGGLPSGLLLASIPLSNPVGSVTGAVLTLSASEEVVITGTGVVGTGVFVLDSGIAIDCTVSALGGSGEVQVPDAQFYAGAFTRVVQGSISL